MFSMPAADDVLPSSKNHGLKPSEDFLLKIRKCCKPPKLQYPGRQCMEDRNAPAAGTKLSDQDIEIP